MDTVVSASNDHGNTLLDMADSISACDIEVFLTNVAWAIYQTYHTVLKASPGATIFSDDIPF